MDDLLPMTLYDFAICIFMVTGGTLIIFFVNPWVILRYGFTERLHEFAQKKFASLFARHFRLL